MMKRSASAGDAQPTLSLNSWDRPLPMKITGLALLVGAALLILGGAYREQANMLTSGLLFLGMGVAFVPGVVRKSWLMRLGLCALVIIGAIYTFVT